MGSDLDFMRLTESHTPIGYAVDQRWHSQLLASSKQFGGAKQRSEDTVDQSEVMVLRPTSVLNAETQQAVAKGSGLKETLHKPNVSIPLCSRICTHLAGASSSAPIHNTVNSVFLSVYLIALSTHLEGATYVYLWKFYGQHLTFNRIPRIAIWVDS